MEVPIEVDSRHNVEVVYLVAAYFRIDFILYLGIIIRVIGIFYIVGNIPGVVGPSAAYVWRYRKLLGVDNAVAQRNAAAELVEILIDRPFAARRVDRPIGVDVDFATHID